MRYIAIFVLCFGIAFGVDCAAKEGSKDMQSSERDGALIRKAMIEFFSEPEKDTYGDFLEEVQRNRAVVNDYGFLIIGPWVYEKDTNEMVRYLDPEQGAGYEYHLRLIRRDNRWIVDKMYFVEIFQTRTD